MVNANVVCSFELLQAEFGVNVFVVLLSTTAQLCGADAVFIHSLNNRIAEILNSYKSFCGAGAVGPRLHVV